MANNTRGTTSRDVNAAFRALQAVKLRIQQKLTYEEIAMQCGYGSRGACHHAVQRELDRCIVSNVEELRKEEQALLNDLQATLFPYILEFPEDDESDEDEDDEKKKKKALPKPNLFVIDRLLAIQRSRRELMGIDADDRTATANMVIIREVPMGLLPLEPLP